MSDSDLLAMLAQTLASIDASLKDIAAFARYQHQQATGEKVHEIAGYVRSENAGGALVHLYSTHPGLKFRVGAVYEEHFAELPFDATKGKGWDGEAAPSIETAKTKGYFVPVAPFSASFLPTGATTDAGLPVYRFNRVVGGAGRTVPAGEGAPLLQSAPVQNGNGRKAAAVAHVQQPAPQPAPAAPAAKQADDMPWCEWCGEHPSGAGIPCDWCQKLGAEAGDGRQLRATPVVKSATSAHACPNCGHDWRFYAVDCRRHQQPDGADAPQMARAHKALSPADLRLWLRQEAYKIGGRACSNRQRHDISGAWKSLVEDDDLRRKAKAALSGYESAGEMPDAMVLAMHGWLRPAGTNGSITFTDSMAGDEIALVLDLLR